ncbi:hypothetical protein DPEC_G00353200 [Dallia pectoralis]|uniref:Uncharacterized protein n=1 Tax=Dallia pectoralis TaxID=75939 RepID=A0ACC2F2T2_DALPE|nr:hypothetical protein DPEC_G00353200 [Dallia pectoralis]
MSPHHIGCGGSNSDTLSDIDGISGDGDKMSRQRRCRFIRAHSLKDILCPVSAVTSNDAQTQAEVEQAEVEQAEEEQAEVEQAEEEQAEEEQVVFDKAVATLLDVIKRSHGLEDPRGPVCVIDSITAGTPADSFRSESTPYVRGG